MNGRLDSRRNSKWFCMHLWEVMGFLQSEVTQTMLNNATYSKKAFGLTVWEPDPVKMLLKWGSWCKSNFAVRQASLALAHKACCNTLATRECCSDHCCRWVGTCIFQLVAALVVTMTQVENVMKNVIFLSGTMKNGYREEQDWRIRNLYCISKNFKTCRIQGT